MDEMANLVIAYDYENVEEFAAYVARKLPKLVTHRCAAAEEARRHAHRI
ncbi:MAG: hypothetical protein QNJ91_02365 [Gammaproteobacteria bacterium]|nr:hypothetical protein [Gammaproteobacteria bacterium]